MFISFGMGCVIGFFISMIVVGILEDRFDDLEREESYRKWEEKSGYELHEVEDDK